jgi:predicted small secreted protein
MKKYLVTAGVGALAFLLSSCFTLQGFSIKAGALKPGRSTTIAVTVHPATSTPSKEYQFVLIGIDTPDDLSAGNATWGTNGKFGGPKAMVVQAGLYTDLGTDCDGSALTLSGLSSYTWKGYTTQTQVRDKGLVAESAVIQIGLKAKNGATSGDPVQVIGVTGIWGDTTGDGVSPDDTFLCTGNGAGAVNII